MCGKKYRGREVYCGRCGALLEIEPNKCSAEKHPLCKGRTVPDNQKYCIYCGALTNYALKKKDGKW